MIGSQGRETVGRNGSTVASPAGRVKGEFPRGPVLRKVDEEGGWRLIGSEIGRQGDQKEEISFSDRLNSESLSVTWLSKLIFNGTCSLKLALGNRLHGPDSRQVRTIRDI